MTYFQNNQTTDSKGAVIGSIGLLVNPTSAQRLWFSEFIGVHVPLVVLML